jgi:hypothetical protein
LPKILKISIAVFCIVVVGFIFLKMTLLNPFNFGTCDGDGPPNREDTSYYGNLKIRYYGTVRKCMWEGEVKYFYETGELEHIANFQQGGRQGLTEYYTRDGKKYRIENFNGDILSDFTIIDLSDSSSFIFAHKKITITKKNYRKEMTFDKPTTLYGFDEPFERIVNGQLLISGREDFYVIDKQLNIKLNLRDTLRKYIPSAYTERIDASGNKYTFLWHRDILGDSLKVKVFYDADDHQSVSKIWVRSYVLK